MKLLIALAIALASTSASAEFRKGEKYDSYYIRMDSDKPISVKVSTVYETTDCNHFGLSGGFRKLETPNGTQTIMQDFVAKFGIMGTEIACPPSDEVRKIPLESDAFVIEPVRGRIYATILVPASFKLVLE